MGRPRFTEVSDEVSAMLQKAQTITNRLDALEKAKCGCPDGDCSCKSCPECGSKKFERLENNSVKVQCLSCKKVITL